MALPFRDINVHASASHYAFTSPSSPSAPTLVVDRPSGDLRLNNGNLPGAKRVSSIAGILGIIRLRLGMFNLDTFPCNSKLTTTHRQVHHCHHQSPTNGSFEGAYDIQGYRF